MTPARSRSWKSPNRRSKRMKNPQAKGITFLKEQQWRMDFATVPVGERELSALLKMNAEVKPAAAGQVQIVAPIAGRIVTAARGAPAPGQKVKQGEELAVILPTPGKNRVELDADLRAVKSELEAAEKELERVQELYKDKIVARRRLEQSERDVAVHQSPSGRRARAARFARSEPAVRQERGATGCAISSARADLRHGDRR